MKKIKEAVEAFKKGEEIVIEFKFTFDERHLLLLGGILTIVVVNLLTL
ncbi:hypothetical protein [Solitalea canadensis]|uniref:Uncharacterized protein n=1 Tax=Solitalea canadensis (strain ATCC 29591 / DSM 3403 / JCM 21819 / LMG 8368 / NBRC 15130 / NCIMB 12057 / USAM 9D) TaxID=929556 RepID=H8KUF9_SOLCM|nr:hypothetical protein [Solitalea canadensis]AFD07324.1 hypothetical protein Solca_2282 [Solitalea canadensis DSM 3403]